MAVTQSSSAAACELTQDGWCVSDGEGSFYGNSERCTITFNVPLRLDVVTFHTEPNVDYIILPNGALLLLLGT